MNQYLRTLSLLALLAGAGAVSAADPGMDFFEKKVRPVLVEHCYKCHSEQTRKHRGGLRLDTRDAMREGGDTGPAVVPGKPDESLFLQAVRYDDVILKMPPKGKLPAAVIADLEKWVKMGAPDPRTGAAVVKKPTGPAGATTFWSFQPPRPHPVPEVKDDSWPLTDIDRFLLAKMEEKGLRPVQDADRATWLRRVTFALVGLPPTPEEVDAFLADHSPDAHARVVDRLLASPAFGERWGRHWLDVARFSESSGGGRTLLFKEAWRYRDYVINSFNADKPFDRFIAEQLAGDLLPWETPAQRGEQLTATAFLVLGPTNYELQDKPVLEMDVIDEQLDTTGRAFLGLTLGCARCHDHKFDPIPTRDYYALAGIYKSTQVLIHSNVSTWVTRPLPVSPEQEAALKRHQAAVAALQKQINGLRTALKKKGKLPAGKGSPVAVASLPGVVLDDVKAERQGEWTHSRYNNNFIGDGYLHDGNAGKGAKSLTFRVTLPNPGTYEVRLAYTPGGNRASNVPVTVVHADGTKKVMVNERKAPPIGGHFVALGKFRFDAEGGQVVVGNAGTDGHVIVDAVQFLSEKELKAKPKVARAAKAAKPSSEAAELKKLEAQLKALQKKAPYRPVTMAVKEAEKVGDCPVCIRGNFHNQGPVVPRGFLSKLPGEKPALPAGESGRRELAEWIASGDNPLTARVAVNRVWHHLFGAGLVRTVDNFGAMGEKPSHPELLDHLALEFVADGWSVKKLIRKIVLSRVYRLSSTPTRDRSADPENRLLSRMNRIRLDAEAVGDALLAVSGRLDRRMGGPNIKPGTTIEYGYQFGGSRRRVYTPVFRNTLPELFEVFDFADPNIVVGRRNVSTTATQALFLMNSPAVMEEAEAAARRLLAEPGLDNAGRVERAYRLALGRAPTEREKALGLEFVGSGKNPGRWARFYQVLFACLDFRYVN